MSPDKLTCAVEALADDPHWYDVDGVPVPSVVSASGSLETATRRPTTLSDARELGLLPSVADIVEVVRRPEVELWTQALGVVAARDLARRAGESEDEFVKRVMAEARSRSLAAVRFGAALRRGAERVAKLLDVDPADPLAAWLNLFRDWFRASCARLLYVGKPLVNRRLGYAGRGDFLMEHKVHGLTLVDLRAQGVTERAGPSAYRSWGYEVAAYREALVEKPVCMTLVVNSREAHPPVEGVWSEEQMEKNWRGFLAARELWVIQKNYNPGSEAGKSE